MGQTVKHHCTHEDCIYRQTIDSGRTPICGYMVITGKSRGCSIADCDKYEAGVKTQPRLTDSTVITWEYTKHDG